MSRPNRHDYDRNPFAAADAADLALPPDLLDELLTPALVVFVDRVRANVRRVLEYTGGPDRWRPHLKTTKIPEIWRELLTAGVRRFKCATTREARVLCELARADGATVDLLVAYPLRGPALARLAALAAAHPEQRLSVLVEDPDVMGDVPDSVGVFVDVNPGMNRTGVPLDDAPAIDALVRGAGQRFRGLHCYDGHHHDPDLLRRRERVFAAYRRLVDVAGGLGAEVGEVVTAGTPAFRHALAFDGFAAAGLEHTVSPGTVVFHDGCTAVENPDVRLTPAALVLTRVVSHPTAGVATCDAGSKSLAAETGDPCAYVLGRRGLRALRPSEEHLPLRADGERPARGELLWLVPRHVCPTVNLAEQAVLVEAGRPPRVVDVAARAHDLR